MKILSKKLALFFIMLYTINTSISNAKTYVGIGFGTTGLNVNASYYFKNLIGIRGEYNYFPNAVLSPLNKTIKNLSDVITDTSSKFQSYGFDVSVRPLFGSWHIDIGVRNMNYMISSQMKANIEDTPYNILASVDYQIAKGWRPYFGTGWTFNPVLGLNINLDIGVILTKQWQVKNPSISFADVPDDIITTEEAMSAQQDVAETINDINNFTPSFLKFWPVIKLGIGWQFDL